MVIDVSILKNDLFKEKIYASLYVGLIRRSIIQRENKILKIGEKTVKVGVAECYINTAYMAIAYEMSDNDIQLHLIDLRTIGAIDFDLNESGLSWWLKIKILRKKTKAATIKQHPEESKYLQIYKTLMEKRSVTPTAKFRNQFSQAMETFSMNELVHAIKVAKQDLHHINQEPKYRYLTPEFLTRPYILNRYVNMKLKVEAPRSSNHVDHLPSN